METTKPMMKHLLLPALLLLALPCFAVDINTPSGILSVDMPADFTLLGQKDLELKFGRGARLPVAAYGNKSMTTTMAVNWTTTDGSALTQKDLDSMRSQLQDALTQQVPGVKWLVSDVRTVNGRRWIYLEYMSAARDSRMHNVTYGTDLHGNLVLLNMSATVADLPAYKQAFKAAGASLKAR